MTVQIEYYPLKIAAKRIGCEIEELVCLAAEDKLSLYIKLVNVEAYKIDDFVEMDYGFYEPVLEPVFYEPEELRRIHFISTIYKLPKTKIQDYHNNRSVSIYNVTCQSEEYQLIKPILLKNYTKFVSVVDLELMANKEETKITGEYSQLNEVQQPIKDRKDKQTNSNDIEFSGLLNTPSKKDAWFSVIDDMTKTFYALHGKVPNETQAWSKLWLCPPDGYSITTGKDKGEDCLQMIGSNPLSQSAFEKRWKNYTKNNDK